MRSLHRVYRVFWLSQLLLLSVSGTALCAASLANSFHDMSQTKEESATCVYCHTPHRPGQSRRALWHRAAEQTTYTVYSAGPTDSRQLPGSACFQVCLGCHDGSVAISGVIPPTSLPAAPDRLASLSGPSPGNSAINDHPTEVWYDSGTDDLNMPPLGGEFPNGVRLIDGKVTCLSCHDPHAANRSSFLVASNGGSDLCYTCHRK